MFKNVIARATAAGLLTVSVAASAAPMAFETATRAASPVSATEELGEGNDVWLILLFAAVAAGIIVAIEGNEGSVDDLPTSP